MLYSQVKSNFTEWTLIAANKPKNDDWICNFLLLSNIKKHQSLSEADVSGSSVE